MSTSSILIAFLISGLISGYGLQKGSLSASGAIAALVIGTIHFSCGTCYGITLIIFFLSSSRLTKVQSEYKSKIEEDFKKDGQRSVWQVLANGLGGTVLAILASLWKNKHPLASYAATLAFLGHYACCCSDTFSSELGILSSKDPTLITSGKAVPKGTNGGISVLGTVAGAAGGLLMGFVFYVSSGGTKHESGIGLSETMLIPVGLLLGIIGTFTDSLLGATCQYTGYCRQLQRVVGRPGPGVQHIAGKALLTNDQVNFVSALLTAISGAFIALLGHWLNLS